MEIKQIETTVFTVNGFICSREKEQTLMPKIHRIRYITPNMIPFGKKWIFFPIFLIFFSLSFSSRTVCNSTSTNWRMRSERYHLRQLTVIAPFSMTLPFPSPRRLLHVCQVNAHHQGHAVTASDILSPGCPHFPKLYVRHQGHGRVGKWMRGWYK